MTPPETESPLWHQLFQETAYIFAGACRAVLVAVSGALVPWEIRTKNLES